MIAEERIAQLETMTLLYGSHTEFAKGVCAMEAVAWLAGEPHSDAPQCACPVVAGFVRRLNDRVPDDETRTRLLRPLLPELVGSRVLRDTMIRRGYVAADFAVRVAVPIAFEARGRKEDAEKLRALAPIVDRETAQAAAYAAAAAADAADAAAYAAAADAYAAAADAAAYAVRLELYDLAVDCIRRMLAVKDDALLATGGGR